MAGDIQHPHPCGARAVSHCVTLPRARGSISGAIRFRYAIIHSCDHFIRGRGLRQGDLRARAAPRGPCRHERARRAAVRHRGLRLGHGQEARRAGARQPRAIPRRAPDGGGPPRRARDAAPPPPARALPRRDARRPLGPRPRRGRGPRARALRGARGADRRQARQPDARSPRRPDPDRRPARRGAPHDVAGRARARRPRAVRPRLGLRAGDAALPRRARNRPRSEARGRRPPALRGPDLRALRGLRRGPRARRPAGRRHARGAGPMSDQAATLPQPAALPEPSALQRLHARGRLRGTIAVLGPAFVACVAYVDPGNFATNIAGGAKYGYLLLWVLLAANLMAMLIQDLSAKVGIATGRNLPELCREHFSRPVSWSLWVQAERIAMATDLAEFVGAAIALNLLFGIPLFPAVAAFAVLALQAKGYRRFEAAIAGLLGLIILGFLYDTLNIGFDAGDAARGFIPGFAGTDSVLLATGILGATVMPHVIYLHSALTQNRIPPRDDAERKRLLHFQRIDVSFAMGIAGLVNISMLVIAAAL